MAAHDTDGDSGFVTEIEVKDLLSAIRSLHKEEKVDEVAPAQVTSDALPPAADDNASVARALRSIKDDGSSELYFDRKSGELRVKRPGQGGRVDGVSATRMAREGFFAAG